MKRLPFILISYLVLCFMFACSSEYHLNKAIAKDPSLLKSDTLVIRDTINFVTDHVEVDSVFMISKDTVTIVKDNLTVRHFYNRDSVYIFAECAEDTVFIPYEKEVLVDKVVYQENESLFPRWLWTVLAIIVGLFILNRFTPLGRR